MLTIHNDLIERSEASQVRSMMDRKAAMIIKIR